MKYGRSIAILFEKDNTALATTMNARSRLRFKKLIRGYVPDGKIFETAEPNKEFRYVAIETVLSDIENYYQAFSTTQAGEHIARNVLELVQKIRLQNDDEEDDEDNIDGVDGVGDSDNADDVNDANEN